MTFKPMLAGKMESTPRFPLLASPKLDGIRATVFTARLLTRTLKEVPNRHIYEMLSKTGLEGLDGELIVGRPSDPACYRNTVSGVMSHDGDPVFSYHVFDHYCHNRTIGFSSRLSNVTDIVDRHPNLPLSVVRHSLIESMEELENYEALQISAGYEGIMLRDPDGPYKFGRSTEREGWLLKVKRFEDSEGILIDVEEEEENRNEATIDERGYTHRTSHKENKVGKNRMGAAVIRDIHSGLRSKIGTGFSAAERQWFWDHRERLVREETILKYRYLRYGVKDLPRHSSYLGLRPTGA